MSEASPTFQIFDLWMVHSNAKHSTEHNTKEKQLSEYFNHAAHRLPML